MYDPVVLILTSLIRTILFCMYYKFYIHFKYKQQCVIINLKINNVMF